MASLRKVKHIKLNLSKRRAIGGHWSVIVIWINDDSFARRLLDALLGGLLSNLLVTTMIMALIRFFGFLNVIPIILIDATKDNNKKWEWTRERKKRKTKSKTYRSSELTDMNSSSEVSTTIAGVRSFLGLLRRTMDEKRGRSWWRNNVKRAKPVKLLGKQRQIRVAFIPFCTPNIRTIHNWYRAIFFLKKCGQWKNKNIEAKIIKACFKGRTW